jgi:uncharacterized membrane protein YtjA (UPF0391 family)
MLGWTIFFFVLTIITAILGFTGITGEASGFLKALALMFLGVCALFLITGQDEPPH